MSPSSISQDVQRHANKVHAFLGAVGNPTDTDRLASEAARLQAATTEVVVAGDINRGKSSLVNVLVDHPGLLPVDVDVTTAVPVRLGFGRPPSATVTRFDPDTGATAAETIDATDLGRYTVSGSGSTTTTVLGAEVFVDHPLLERGLTLIDTPGVGGMSQAHRDHTIAALAHADALVFVVSAVEPVTRSELEFLGEASERLSNVILVASRADLGTAEANATIMVELKDKISALADLRQRSGDSAAATRLRRIAGTDPILASSHLAHQAIRRVERGRAEQAATYRRRSGIDEVQGRLEATMAARDDVRLTNLLQLIDTLLTPIEAMLADRLRALDGDGSAADALEARRADLETAAGQQARWRSVLGTGISRMQTSINREVSRELATVRDRYRTVLETQADDVDLDALGVELQQALQTAWVNLADRAARQFDEVVATLLDELTIEGEAGVLGELAQPPALASLQNRSGIDDKFGLLDDAVPLATQAFLFGNIANVMAGVLGFATGGLGLVAYGIGASIAAPVVILRRKQRERRRQIGETQRALNEALFGQEGLARELATELNLRIVDARAELETMIEQRLVARRKDLEAQLRELNDLLRAETAERETARKQTDRRMTELGILREEATRLSKLVEERISAHMGAASPTEEPPVAPDQPVGSI